MAAFDPTQFGATPAQDEPQAGGGFDATKFGATAADDSAATPHPDEGFFAKLGRGALGVGKALVSSETGFGNDITGAASQILPKSLTGVDKLDQASQQHAQNLAQIAALVKSHDAQGKDTTKLRGIMQDEVNNSPDQLHDLFPALKKTNLQVAGDAGGTLLDILSAGTYGTAAKGAKTAKLLTAADHTAAMIAAGIQPKVAVTLGEKLGQIGASTAKLAATGGAAGYGYDVSGNLQAGKEGGDAFKPGIGTFTGAAAPIVIGGVRAGVAISKEAAPAFINSLIKPKTADFAYGKDPGRTVSELGITGNSLDDFGKNISENRQEIGRKLGAIYSSPTNAEKVISAEDALKPIDDAMDKAAKGGKNNQGIVSQLQNIKDALLYSHVLDENGSITKEKIPFTDAEKQQNALFRQHGIGSPIDQKFVTRDLTKLTPQEAQDFIQHVADQTQFTGRPSDDKAVNSALKEVYAAVRDKINSTVETDNPEVHTLNRQYGDLVSAELAVKNRDAIVKRANLISMPIKVGGTAAALTALASGGAAIPTILAGMGAAAVDKALGSTAVKTRIAAWLGKETVSGVQKVLTANPGLAPILAREFPAFISKISANPQP